tara:strand:+ start:184 stop:393 length:210 start_codon:yes stop_codon:yes gene_type:complete
MKNIFIMIVGSLLLVNCTSKVTLGPKCTKVSKAGSYEKSYVWLKSSLISDKEFKERVSADYCPKKAKKS